MIDLHCHLLPGVDDGAADLHESLAMARLAVADGTTHAVLTPHVWPGRYDNTLDDLRPVFDQFRAALIEAGIPLSVDLAGEVRVDAEVLTMVAGGNVPVLGQWDGEPVVLLELPHTGIPPGSDKLVGWMRAHGYRPMLAHPERNPVLLSDHDRIRPFLELGCLLQITAGSITGLFKQSVRELAHYLLDEGWVTVIASDAHDTRKRVPGLSAARDAAAGIIGDKAAGELVLGNPARIVGRAGNTG